MKAGAGERESPSSPRRPDIQGLRAIAVLVVVAFHTGLALPGGFVGVDVFFVISGFVITGMLAREVTASGRIDLRRFYMRRFRRLAPALAVMVGVTVILAAFILSPVDSQGVTVITALGALLLFANYSVARSTGGYFDPAADTNALLHTWTLSLEEQFYIVFPLVLLLGWWLARRAGQRWILIVTVAALAVVSFGIAIVGALEITIPLMPDALVGFYGPLSRAWEFAVGALLALALPLLGRIGRVPATVCAVAGLVLIGIAATLLTGDVIFPGPFTLIPVAGAGLLLVAGSASGNLVSRILSTRPAVAIGDLSYSWYLWHWPFIVFAMTIWPGVPWVAPIAAVLSLLPAIASYRWIERPTRYAETNGRRFAGLVAATLVPALVLTGGVGIAVSEGYWSPGVRQAQAARDLHAGYDAGCVTKIPISDATADDCTWNPGATGDPVYLFGDSLAEHYTEGLAAAGERTDRPLVVMAASDCPPFEVRIPRDGEIYDYTDDVGCTEFIVDTIAWIQRQPPGLVILGQNDIALWNPNQPVPDGFDDPGKIQAVVTGMTATITALQAAGHRVVIAQAPPEYVYPSPRWRPELCSLPVLIADECRMSRSLDLIDGYQHVIRAVIEEIAADTGSGVFDSRDHFCEDGICSTTRDGEMLYRDAIHLSILGSQALADEFTELLERDAAEDST